MLNNTGTLVQQGTVVQFDTNAALATNASGLVAAAHVAATRASFVLTAQASTASFPATGAVLITPSTAVGAAAPLGIGMAATSALAGPFAGLTLGSFFISYTALAGVTFTGCRAMYQTLGAGAGLQLGAVINAWPGPISGVGALPASSVGGPSPLIPAAQVGLPGTTPFNQDTGRMYTLAGPGVPAANSPLTVGVVGPTSDAALNSTLIQPGNPSQVVLAGAARVCIGASTVAAAALLTGDIIIGQAIGGGTIGNLLGIALESQANIDTNNCIRAAIKIG